MSRVIGDRLAKNSLKLEMILLRALLTTQQGRAEETLDVRSGDKFQYIPF